MTELTYFLGRFPVLVLHLPIGLLGLAVVLEGLRERAGEIDHVIVEASGVSDPARIGDYAATISRQAAQLKSPPPPRAARGARWFPSGGRGAFGTQRSLVQIQSPRLTFLNDFSSPSESIQLSGGGDCAPSPISAARPTSPNWRCRPNPISATITRRLRRPSALPPVSPSPARSDAISTPNNTDSAIAEYF